jgi:uncharacterized membrane protein
MASRSLTDLRNMEVLSHGVYAIAITLLVLDIRVPPVEQTATGSDLVQALVDGWPRYLAYVLGFMYIGAYWLAANRTNQLLRGSDHRLLVLGLIVLMAISAIPFVTSLLAEYIGQDGGRQQVAVAVFTGWGLLLSVLANIALRYAVHDGRLVRPDVNPGVLRRWLWLAGLGPLTWAVALVAALFVSATVTLVLDFAILVIFLIDVPLGEGEAGGEGETDERVGRDG